MDTSKMDGQELVKYTQKLFHTQDISSTQLDYVLTMLDPVSYALAHHRPKGHKLTFNVPDFDYNQAVRHRPYQKEVLKAITNVNEKEVNIIKSRQLGFSEVGVMGLIYMLDFYSFDAFKVLYAFPKRKWGVLE